jgi:hypothetical protein
MMVEKPGSDQWTDGIGTLVTKSFVALLFGLSAFGFLSIGSAFDLGFGTSC